MRDLAAAVQKENCRLIRQRAVEAEVHMETAASREANARSFQYLTEDVQGLCPESKETSP
jgi:hypothetical protein